MCDQRSTCQRMQMCLALGPDQGLVSRTRFAGPHVLACRQAAALAPAHQNSLSLVRKYCFTKSPACRCLSATLKVEIIIVEQGHRNTHVLRAHKHFLATLISMTSRQTRVVGLRYDSDSAQLRPKSMPFQALAAHLSCLIAS